MSTNPTRNQPASREGASNDASAAKMILAFNDIIPRWHEARHRVHDRLKCTSNYTDDGFKGGKALRAGCSAIIRPLIADFVIDVEVTARRALTPTEHKDFLDHYLDPEYDSKGQLAALPRDLQKLDHTVRMKVGKHLMFNQIWPISRYVQPVDTRRKRQPATVVDIQAASAPDTTKVVYISAPTLMRKSIA